ncbi:MAG TPA: hypothetical protein PLI94_01185 [Bacillota bacterium]|nr:hypothetical protein [Bacillota bacterium]
MMEREHGGEGRVPWQMLLAWWQDKTAGSRRLLLPVATIVGLGLLLLWAGNPVTPAPTAPRVLLDHSTEERVPAREGDSWTEAQWERELATTLSRISGAGRVWVDLTLEGSEVHVWQEKEEQETRQVREGEGGGRQEQQRRTSRDLVFTQGGRGEAPVLQQRKRPKVLGVVVIAEGARDMGVREDLWHATAIATGTELHRVVVMAGTEPSGGERQ